MLAAWKPLLTSNPQVLGAIAIAPMQDFKAAGNTVFERARQRRLLLRFIPQASVDMALANILNKNQLDSNTLNFKYSAVRLNKPLLMFSGELDWITPPAQLNAGAIMTHVQLPYLTHFMLLHP